MNKIVASYCKKHLEHGHIYNVKCTVVRRVKIRIEMLPEVLEESMLIAISGYSEIDKTVW